MPHNSKEAEEKGERIEAEVLERPAINNGDPVWQAEIQVPQGGVNHSGQSRLMNIRGPPRKTRETAESDAEKLTNTSPEGAKAVRALANSLHRG